MVESVPKRELGGLEVTMGRLSAGSDVVIMDDRILETAARSAVPPVQNLNVTRSTRVHIGPKFVSVTQNVDNTEVVKGRIMGLELVSPKNTRRLRCSIAVFVCWTLVVACVLTFIIFQYALAKPERRLDIDLPLPGYLWNIAKSTTKAERLSCAAAITILIICIILIAYFTVTARTTAADDEDVAPHEWFITRDMWLAPKFNTTERTQEFEPLRLVIISHTAGSECRRFVTCAAELRNLQSWYERAHGYDISYNFLIGNEGRVYEARGWNVVGRHTDGYNECSLNIAFMGDYREGLPHYSKVKAIQLERAKMLLAQGVELGHLHAKFQVLGSRDLRATISPGDNIYNTIRQWENFDHDNMFRDRSCHEIRSMFEDDSTTTTLSYTQTTTAEPQDVTTQLQNVTTVLQDVTTVLQDVTTELQDVTTELQDVTTELQDVTAEPQDVKA